VAKELALTQHLSSKEDSIGSPYLVARREWDERYGGLIKRAQQWRGAAVLALLVALAEAIVIVGVATRPRTTPYVVAVDSLGRVAAAGAVVAAALQAVQAAAVPGASTLSVDEIAESVIREAGATPSFLGYHGYPASICASINDRVVHGIPSAAEILAPADLLSIDCGAVLEGWHGDAAVTFGIGALDPADEVLSAATKESLVAGIAAMISGNRLTDVAHAIEQGTRAAEARYGRKFGIVEGYGGHGIGRQMHMDPFLPNEGSPGRGPMLAAGSVLAIEPMLTLGARKTVVLDDEWTVTTADGSRAAHWEHTVAATEDGPRILTLG